MTGRTKATALATLVALGIVAAACGSSSKKSDTTTTTAAAGGATTTAAAGGATTTAAAGAKGGTLVFGTSRDPVVLDGAFVSDGESLRPIKQIFETMVTTAPGSTDIVAALAEKWTASADGMAWTFNLRKGVKFQDATPFNAAAVCFNFDRWYNFTGLLQSADVSYYWGTIFGGYAKNEDSKAPVSLYKSCEAKDDATAVINLTSPSAAFLAGLAVPAFSIASPDALKKYEADKVSGKSDSPSFDGTFGTEHPIGTGPLKLDSWVKGDKLTLVRNDDYWGDKSLLDKVIFKPLKDGPSRRQALETGEIQGYDLVAPADVAALSAKYNVLQRPAFNVGYVGMNQKKAPLDNVKIRQAIAFALNRPALVKAKYPAGAEVATQFMPPDLFGWSKDVPKYDYNPDKAKQLIKDSGVTDLTIEFWYPTNVSRPYMPDPEANFTAFKTDLEAVGFKVVPKSAPWSPDYLNAVNAGNVSLYLLGWTGDYGDPDNFVGVFFRTPQDAWGFSNQELFDGLTKARDIADVAARTKDYVDLNNKIMEFVPGVPYVHTKPSLAFDKKVKGFVPSPVQNEDFSKVSFG